MIKLQRGADGYLLDLTSSNTARLIVGSKILITTDTIPASQWTHLTATSKKNEKMRIYINDVLKAEMDADTSNAPDNNLSLRLGADSTAGSQFTGYLDEVLIRNYITGATPTPGPTATPAPTGSSICMYLFEEASGGTVNDSSGNNNNGTIVGNDSRVAGHSGQAISLDGSTYVNVPDSASLDSIVTELVIDVWVYPTTSGSYRRLVDKITAGGADGFLLDLTPSNNARFIVGSQLYSTTDTIPASQWSHLKGTYKKNDKLRIYINDVLKTEQAATNTDVPANNLSLRLGADSTAASKFTGYLDEVIVRNSITEATPTPGSTSTPTPTPTPGPTTLFYDGFESYDFTTGGWTNSGCTIGSTYKYAGTYAAIFNSSDSLTKAQSTAGYKDIQVKYARYTRNCETDYHFIAEWHDGSMWTGLEDLTGNSSWTEKTWNLPAGANNNANLQVRFKTSHNGSTDYAYLDEVRIIGTPQ